MNYRYLLPGTTVYPGGSAVYGAGSAFSNTSYTVRGFAPNVISLPITPIDEQYHSKQYFMEQDPIDLSWSYRNTFPYGATATNVPNIIQEQWVGTAEIGGGPAPYLDFQTQTTLSGSGIYGIQYTQTLLDTLPQYVGSNVGDLGPGNGWLGGDISQDGKHIYGVSVPFGGSGVTISVFSDSRSYDLRGLRNETRSDNLLAPWGISSATPGYYFQMGVWEFPGSSAVSPGSCSIQFIDANANSLAVALNGTSLVYNGTASNAASSWITYPSGTAATGGTSTFATGSGTAAGYGMTVRIDAASVNAYIDLTKLQQVGFNLGSADTKYALNVSNLKLIKSTYGEFGAGVQTKLGYFQGEFWPQVTQSSFPPIYQDTFLAKDYTYVVRFNSGSLPASANAFSVYARINPDRVGSTNDYLHIKVQSDSSSTQMFGYDGGASGTARPQLFNEIGPVLAEKTDYVFLLYLNGSKVNAEIRSLSAASLGGNYSFQTDIYSTYANTSGYVGYSLVPQTGNFYVDYMYAKDVILAQYTSENFNSSLPVTGVSLYTNTSAPNNIITYANGTAVNFYPEDSITLDNLWAQAPDSSETAGYATASPDYLFLPPQITTPSIKITKNIVYANIGGVRYYTPFTANRSRAISVQGKLYYQGALDLTRQSSINPSIDQKKGVFRVVLWDKYFRKTLFVSDILQLTPNSWNDFEVDINTDIYDNELQLEIQHVGTVENTTLGTTNPTASFWLNDIKVLYRGIEWEASNNNGLSWVPFYDNVNQPYAGVHFSNDVYSYLVNGDNAVVYWQFDELSGTAILNFATSTGAANNAHYSSGTSLLSYNTSLSGHTDPLNDGVRIAGSTSPATAILTSPVWPGIPSGKK